MSAPVVRSDEEPDHSTTNYYYDYQTFSHHPNGDRPYEKDKNSLLLPRHSANDESSSLYRPRQVLQQKEQHQQQQEKQQQEGSRRIPPGGRNCSNWSVWLWSSVAFLFLCWRASWLGLPRLFEQDSWFGSVASLVTLPRGANGWWPSFSPLLRQSFRPETDTVVESKTPQLDNHNNNKNNNTKRVTGLVSYLEFAGAPLNVSYTAQALLVNGQPILLVGGSMHPSRATGSREEWEHALDHAVDHGLNLITLYVFWSAHQPYGPNQAWNGTLSDTTAWELADAIQSCATRGLFVHVRVGPYTCAEYSYGGLPAWIGVQYPNIRMRRMDPTWLELMERYIQQVTVYLTHHQLWAHQGGPILLAQIENELGQGDNTGGFMVEHHTNATNRDDDDDNDDNDDDSSSSFARNEIQDYADWCGELVQRVAPEPIVWTMCNGASARNTIETYNGDFGALDWLARHGDSGRIQVDQPALWTELEQGYQVWGETPDRPVDYFWGHTARTTARLVLQWVARGGRHFNYYMWWGGSNTGTQAAAGILQAYATDAMVCPSGEARQPKFGHLQTLHHVVASVATVLLHTTARSLPLQVYDAETDTWRTGSDQVAFVYDNHNNSLQQQQQDLVASDPHVREVLFVENNAEATVLVQLPPSPLDNGKRRTRTLAPYSAVLLVNRTVVFASDTIAKEAMAFSRTTVPLPTTTTSTTVPTNKESPVPVEERFLSSSFSSSSSDMDNQGWLQWNSSWREPVVMVDTTLDCQQEAFLSRAPVEQTTLLYQQYNATNRRPRRLGQLSDYAWYSVAFTLDHDMEHVTLVMETDKATALVVYLNGTFQGSVNNHEHGEGTISQHVSFLSSMVLSAGYRHDVTILAEALGYHNLIGRWGGSVTAKHKGLVGAVTLVNSVTNQTVSLVSENNDDKDETKKNSPPLWCSLPGLAGERIGLFQYNNWANNNNKGHPPLPVNVSEDGPLWQKALFETPLMQNDHQYLYLHVTQGRGHFWLNGHDLGRYWNITRTDKDHFPIGTKPTTTTVQYSQQYYHLPRGLLRKDGRFNELVLVNVLAPSVSVVEQTLYQEPDNPPFTARLVMSWVEPSMSHSFDDEVGFADSCLL